MKKTISACLTFLLSYIALNSQNVEVIIKGIRSERGQVSIGVYKDEDSFRKEKAFLNFLFPKETISAGEMRIRLTLEPGVYGLASLDDENNDGKMEYNIIGIPKEGFGFSNFYLSGFSRPKFEDFKFIVNPGEKKSITIRYRYIL